MSYDIYYTIRGNEKKRYEVDTLFFGVKEVFDFPIVFDTPFFDTYDECLKYIYDHNLINVHIRKTLSCGGGVFYTDYKTMFNYVYKGIDFRDTNSYPYNRKFNI